MNRGTILFAKIVIYLVGIAALAICTILLPELAREETVANPDSANMTAPFLLVSFILATPFFIALFQTHKLVSYIDSNKAFSKESIRTLQIIKICSIVFSALIMFTVIGGITIARMTDPREDVTFMIPFGFIFTFVPSVIAVFVAVLQRLLSEALAMKSENDLIV